MVLLQAVNIAKEAVDIAQTDWERVGIITVFATMFFILLGWYVYRENYHTRQARRREKEFWEQTQERERFWEGRLDDERKMNDNENQMLLGQVVKASDLNQNFFYILDKMLKKFGLNAKMDISKIDEPKPKQGDEIY